ncbi:hypothetical protein CXP39_00750 [Mesoplasma syrphidae]|uniref:Uncharacterized protein n=1 Tax=Mesoplasma syrphidae TaxID=225999 RepID=A0A2K9BY99_9MOLU|nr:hypothetical protein [Mesoplasma syrphidae]AUF83338.1 hypothetical protein CXP39_00750 [Mesoplasma syrphidae]
MKLLLSILGATALISGPTVATFATVHEKSNSKNELNILDDLTDAKTNITTLKPNDVQVNLAFVEETKDAIAEEILLSLMIGNPEIPELIDIYLSFSDHKDIWDFRNINLEKPKPGLVTEFENATLVAKSNNPDFLGAIRFGVKLTNSKSENLVPLSNHLTRRNLGMLTENSSQSILKAVKEKNPNVILSEIEATQISSIKAIIVPIEDSTIYDSASSVEVNYMIPNSPTVTVDLKQSMKVEGIPIYGTQDYFVVEKNVGRTTSDITGISWVDGNADSRVTFSTYSESATIVNKNTKYSVSSRKVTGVESAFDVTKNNRRINETKMSGGISPSVWQVQTHSGFSQYKNETGETILQFVGVIFCSANQTMQRQFHKTWSGRAVFNLYY